MTGAAWHASGLHVVRCFIMYWTEDMGARVSNYCFLRQTSQSM